MRTALASQPDHDADPAQPAAERARSSNLGYALPAEPLELYAGVPLPGHIPGVLALARAYAHFRSHYRPDDPEHRLILDGASRAFTALQERSWSVLADGTLEIAGSRGDTTYLVSDADCRQKGRTRTDKRSGRSEPALCPSFLFAQRRHGGACYHVIARELLRLAQLIELTADAPLPDAAPADALIPFVTLGGRLLGLAFGIARLPEQAVTLALDATWLTVSVGVEPLLHTTCLTCDEGCGHITIRLDTATFAELWQPFRPIAASLPLVTLFVDPASGLVRLVADQVVIRSRGTVL